MPDAIFAHPLLARIYDAFDGHRDDLDLYINLIRELGAQHVLDVGCGTGSLPVLLASSGVKVTAVDPGAALVRHDRVDHELRVGLADPVASRERYHRSARSTP